MSDTPESDKNSIEWDRANTAGCSLEHARRLERERDEARKDAAMWKSNHDNQVELKSIISKRGDLKDRAPRVEKLISERDQLRAINAELLETLELALHVRGTSDDTVDVCNRMQSAINKAKETQP